MVTKLFSFVLFVTLSGLCHGMSIGNQSRSSHLGMLNPGWTFISNYSFTVAVCVDIDLLGGGALITQRWVLTAASVMRDFKPSDVKVRVGSNSAFQGGRVHGVIDAVIHPNYTTNSSYNLALLELDAPIYPQVAAKVNYFARIPFMDNGVLGNMTGYGATSSSQVNGNPGVQLAQGHVYTANYCRDYWRRPISSLHICAYSYSAVPCLGDVGDPVTRCWDGSGQCELLGIVAGIDLCDTYEPYALMDVGQFAPWILEVINRNETKWE